MATHNIYLKIEQVLDYSPVEPDMMAAPPKQYRRDCMRNPGHEDTTIPLSEVNARMLAALVYREYLDKDYLIPKPDKLVLADVNEPRYSRRVPGTVIYTQPGERLRIHVLNADSIPHSLHVHGLRYGIDSDGSWPFGTQSTDARRSDEICPGQMWIYAYDVTDEMVGAWPFHDHCHRIAESINRGLFGGIIVHPREYCDYPPRIELPSLVEEFLRERMKSMEATDSDGEDDDDAKPKAIGDKMKHRESGILGLLREDDFEVVSRRMFLEDWAQLSYAHPTPKHEEVLHVPLFFHFMNPLRGTPAFNSGAFAPGAPPFEVTFGAEGSFSYHCEIHPIMQAKVTVVAGEAAMRDVNILDAAMPFAFDPLEVKVRPGGIVRWHAGTQTHTITEDAAGIPSYCLNGRSFVGNTPTILAHAGQKIRWYVFNLDLGMNWHNFHPHGQRWNFAKEPIDIRSIGPAESFVVETTAPPVLLMPPDIAKTQDKKHRPKDAKEYKVRGDFLFHCHVEMHMMQGLAGLVRSHQSLWLTPKQAKRVAATTGIPLDNGDNMCPDIDPDRCNKLGCGEWEEVAGLPEVTFMHAALLPNTTKVLFWGYGDTRFDISRVWDYSTPAGAYALPMNQPNDVSSSPGDQGLQNIWSAEHAFLDNAEGTLLAHGGFTPRETYLFHAPTQLWSRGQPTHQDRFYSTTLTLADGKILTLFGSSSRSVEVYDPLPGTWSAPIPLPNTFDYTFYPWTYLLPGGDLFIAGTGDHAGATGLSHRFDWSAPIDDPARTWPTISGNRSMGGEKGTSVLLPLRPPAYKPQALIAGGDSLSTVQTAEMIDLSAPTPAWTALPNLHQARTDQVNTVLLPDGRVFLAGGIFGAGGPAEIFDPQKPGDGWMMCAEMKYSRGYHSAAILLADGSVLMGGDLARQWKSGEMTPNERYYPSYYFMARPVITNAPPSLAYNASFTIDTPSPSSVAEVVLLRAGAVTHGFNMSQRFVECAITGTGATSLQVKAPADGNIAPPGYYLLFIVDGSRVPSTAKWIRVTP